MAETNNNQPDSGIDLGQSVSKAEGYLQENKKSLTIIIGAIVVVVMGYFSYQKFIVEPANQEATTEMFTAEGYFKADSLDKALNGDGITTRKMISPEHYLTEVSEMPIWS